MISKRKEADRIFLQLPTTNPNAGFAGLTPLPHFLALTTFTNHIGIINRCRTMSPTMVAEYQRLLIPKEVMRKSLEEYCLFLKHDMAKG